ncbi:Abi-like protein [Staphylococcus aureus subsp. aureus IS-3]|nr:Abi-like protein [Staphylococcus aureus subsp. aureus IS-3]
MEKDDILAEIKPMLNFDEQIAKLKQMNIFFNIIDTEKANEILRKNNYFFKLAYFRKNFEKKNGGYFIEFAYLSDLATIDMKLRYTMLHLTLDIEHSLKCLVLKLITENNQEDGYKIIDEFLCIDKSYSNSNFDTNSRTPEEVMETKIKNKNEIFKHMNKRGQLPEKLNKYYQNPPAWVCIEFMQLGQFVSFLNFYYKKYNDEELRVANILMPLLKNIRNKSAHNQPIIANLNYDSRSPQYLFEKGNNIGISRNMFGIKNFIDTFATLELHNQVCSNAIIQARYHDLDQLQKRYKRNESYYNNALAIKRFFIALDKIIDFNRPKV